MHAYTLSPKNGSLHKRRGRFTRRMVMVAGLAVVVGVLCIKGAFTPTPSKKITPAVQESPEAKYKGIVGNTFGVTLSQIEIDERSHGICTTDCTVPEDPFNYSGKAILVSGRDSRGQLRKFAFTKEGKPLWQSRDNGEDQRIFILHTGAGKHEVLKVADRDAATDGWTGRLIRGRDKVQAWMDANILR